MSMSRREALILGAAAVPAPALFWGAAYAQQPGGAARAAASGQDPLLAACLLIGGRKQIGKCQFALKYLKMDDTKAFAEAEIKEHEMIRDKLKELGLEYPAPAKAAAGARPRAADAPAPAAALQVGQVTLPPGASAMVLVDHEVAEQCVANFKAAMERKEGLKFEKAFVGDQLHEHMGLLDRAQVFKKHASQAMQPVLKEGQQIIEKHIATLEGLMAKLDERKDERTSK